MSNVVQLKPVVETQRKRRRRKIHKCKECKIKYIDYVMCTYKPPNYGYYKKKAEYFCLCCYNKKFY